MEMTAKKLKELCRKDSLYSTPYLNDKLYLHYKGFRLVENLGDYTGLKVLWLEGNGLGAIQGLESQTEMRTLYLQENLIERVENLGHMRQLNTLNLNKNLLRELPAAELAELPALQTLMVGHNHIASAAACAGLRACAAVSTLDLQENRIEDPEVLDVLADMPALAVLYLQGNPCVKKIRHYRRHVIGRLPGLKYLDDRPVFDDERKRCDVWYSAWVKDAAPGAAAGGGAGYNDAAAMAAERAEMERQRAEKVHSEERNFNAFADFVRRSAEDRAREEAAAAAMGTGPNAGAGDDAQGDAPAPFELEAPGDASNLPELAEGDDGQGDDEDGEGEGEGEGDLAAGTDAMSAAIRAFARPGSGDAAPTADVPAAAAAVPPRRTGGNVRVKPAMAPPPLPPPAARATSVPASQRSSLPASVSAVSIPDSSASSPAPAPAPMALPADAVAAYAAAVAPNVAVNPFSGEPLVPTAETAEARQYREERWQRILAASNAFRGTGNAVEGAPAPLPVSATLLPHSADAAVEEAAPAGSPATAVSVGAAAPQTADAAEAAAASFAERLAAVKERAEAMAVAFAAARPAAAAGARGDGEHLRLLKTESVGEGDGDGGGGTGVEGLLPPPHNWVVIEGTEPMALAASAPVAPALDEAALPAPAPAPVPAPAAAPALAPLPMSAPAPADAPPAEAPAAATDVDAID